jgi:hypothetical protein
MAAASVDVCYPSGTSAIEPKSVPAMIFTTTMVAVREITNQVRRSLRLWSSPRKACLRFKDRKEGPCIDFIFAVRLSRSGGSFQEGADDDQLLGAVGVRLAGWVDHMVPDMLFRHTSLL